MVRRTVNGEKIQAMYNKKHLGAFETLEGAYKIYANEKEKVIKQIADEYKKYIPKKLYDALLKYKVRMEYDKNYEIIKGR